MLEFVEFLIECCHLLAGVPIGSLILLKELESTVHTYLLACIDERHAGESVHQHCKSLLKISETFKLGSLPCIEVVVGDHIHHI